MERTWNILLTWGHYGNYSISHFAATFQSGIIQFHIPDIPSFEMIYDAKCYYSGAGSSPKCCLCCSTNRHNLFIESTHLEASIKWAKVCLPCFSLVAMLVVKVYTCSKQLQSLQNPFCSSHNLLFCSSQFDNLLFKILHYTFVKTKLKYFKQ